MREQDIEILSKQSNIVLANWFCLLNTWNWPTAIPEPEPSQYFKDSRRGETMSWIKNRVGQRLVLRVWNKDMTDEQFEDFYKRKNKFN